MSALPPDDDHPYGHGRFEAVGSLGVSVLLLITAWHIALHAYDKLQHCLFLNSFPVITIPGWSWLGKCVWQKRDLSYLPTGMVISFSRFPIPLVVSSNGDPSSSLSSSSSDSCKRWTCGCRWSLL